jgi:hypothetical protein
METVLASVIPAPRLPGAAVLPGTELLYVILAPTQATLDELPLHLERRERKRDGNWGKPQPARLTADRSACCRSRAGPDGNTAPAQRSSGWMDWLSTMKY